MVVFMGSFGRETLASFSVCSVCTKYMCIHHCLWEAGFGLSDVIDLHFWVVLYGLYHFSHHILTSLFSSSLPLNFVCTFVPFHFFDMIACHHAKSVFSQKYNGNIVTQPVSRIVLSQWIILSSHQYEVIEGRRSSYNCVIPTGAPLYSVYRWYKSSDRKHISASRVFVLLIYSITFYLTKYYSV